MTKKEATKKITALRQAFFNVVVFQSDMQVRQQMKGVPDYLIINQTYIIWLELKLKSTKDKLRKEQIEFLTAMRNNMKENAGRNFVGIVNEDNIDKIINAILINDYKHLFYLCNESLIKNL